jgi:sorbitol/mannitol transport system permease protein
MTFLTKNVLGVFDTHFLVIVVLCLINPPDRGLDAVHLL